MFLKFALKNIRAYTKRSLVTILLTTVSTALLIFSSGWMNGSHKTMIKSSVEVYPGYLQITNKDFRESPSFDHLIFESKQVAKILDTTPGISVFGRRFESFVLYSTGPRSIGGRFTGIEPDTEPFLSRLKSSLKKGHFLETTDTGQVYMGIELARKLGVGVGDQLSFIGTGADYSFAADTITVKGLFQTGLFDFDATSAFVNLDYFQDIMAGDNMATHFIVLPGDKDNVEQLARTIANRLGPEYQIVSWMQSMSGLVRAMEIDSIFGYLTLAIIFIVIFFVIMIYTWLAVFARIREIGILRGIGTSPRQIFQLLLTESVLLSLLSIVLGTLLGGTLSWYFSVHPITFSGYEEQFKQYGLVAAAMPTEFAPLTILRDAAIMLILSVGSTLYPILQVIRLPPIKAINHV